MTVNQMFLVVRSLPRKLETKRQDANIFRSSTHTHTNHHVNFWTDYYCVLEMFFLIAVDSKNYH